MTTWANYAPGGEAVAQEIPQEDGSLLGTVIDGSWKMTDTYHVNNDKTAFNGREVIFKDGMPIWAANYHSVIPDPTDSTAVLEFFYGTVAANPNPVLPVTAIDGTENDQFRFKVESMLGGKPTLARFVLAETILYKPTSRASFLNHVIGGWIN
ncbi:MAG: hypothetical protein WDN27_00800 [Candidatus Saccharibacteria bacterium]